MFFSKVDLNDRQVLQGYRKEFLGHVKTKLHGDYDRGFFSACADCMRVLAKMANDPKSKAATHKKEEPKTLKTDEKQITIESFLRSGKR